MYMDTTTTLAKKNGHLDYAYFIMHVILLIVHALEHSTGSERVDALGQRAVEVIICMITRDFSVISMTSQASLSLSLSLLLTKVTHAQYRKRFRASYNAMTIRHCTHSPSILFSCKLGGGGAERVASRKSVLAIILYRKNIGYNGRSLK